MRRIILTALVVAAAGLSFGVFSNGDMEGTPIVPAGPWDYYRTDLSVAAGARTGGSGTQVLQVLLRSGYTGGSVYQTGLAEILPDGTTWRVKGWVRFIGTPTTGVTFNWGFWGTGSPYGASSTNVVIPGTATTWAEYTVDHSWTTADFADGYCDVQGSFANGTGGTDTVQLDDVSLQSLAAVNDWSIY